MRRRSRDTCFLSHRFARRPVISSARSTFTVRSLPRRGRALAPWGAGTRRR
jgi:hypothetical protein